MQMYTCLALALLVFVINSRLRVRAFHQPEAQEVQLAYAVTRWLISVAILWWIVILTTKIADRYLPNEILIEERRSSDVDETTTDFFSSSAPVLE